MPANQGQWGNCTAHAICCDIEAEVLHKHDIVLDYTRAVNDLTRAGEAADGSNPADVLQVIRKDKELFFYEQIGGSTNKFRVKIQYEQVQDGFLRLCKRMEGYDRIPRRAVVVMEPCTASDEDSDDDVHALHAVAARGVYESEDMAAEGTYVVHGCNSHGASMPIVSVHAGNYKYHVEFTIEIERIWNLQGLPQPHPKQTGRFLAAQKREAKVGVEKQRQEAIEAKMKELEKTIEKQTRTIKKLKAEKGKMQVQVTGQGALLQRQGAIITETKQQTKILKAQKQKMQMDVARQDAHWTTLLETTLLERQEAIVAEMKEQTSTIMQLFSSRTSRTFIHKQVLAH